VRAVHRHYLAQLVSWARFRATTPPRPRRGQVLGYTTPDRAKATEIDKFAATVVPTFRGKPTIGQLAALSPTQLVQRILDGAYAQDLPTGGFWFTRPQVLGHVAAGAALAYAIVQQKRSRRTRLSAQHTVAVPLKREQGRWRIVLTTELTHVQLPMTADDPMLSFRRSARRRAG